MYIPDASTILDHCLFVPALPFEGAHFSLDISGVMGIFGGDEAISAMATVHVYRGRRWLGWYNSPGSYQIARRYGLLAESTFFKSFFPGVRTDPATLFELDGWKGPKFRAAHSGTIIEQTGHLAALLMKECAALQGSNVDGRRTQPIGVTIVELNHVPAFQIPLAPTNMKCIVSAVLPIGVSVGACMACAFFHDWYSFSAIFLGMFTSGLSCLIIGSGKLVFEHPEPANGSPPGDGILGSDKEFVLLKGPEGAVNTVTRGWFSLNFSSEPQHKNIGLCSVFLAVQFVTQLLLIPQGFLFGQVMFLISLAASWIYSLYLSSFDRGRIQRDILLKDVLQDPVLTKYILGTRTTMVVFVLLVLQPEEPGKLLDELLPNGTNVWKYWKATIVQRLIDHEELKFVESDWESLIDLIDSEKALLKTLYGDAQAAYAHYTSSNERRGD